MIRSCPNCASRLVYDISLGALSCNKCGGIFTVEEIDTSKFIDEDIRPSLDRANDISGVSDASPDPFSETATKTSKEIDQIFAKEAHRAMMDTNVYSCPACGADIIVSNTEASTFCIYCGNPSIVFSRIKSVQRPEGIIPFSVSRTTAVDLIRKKLTQGAFIPNEIKNFKSESIVGLYVPYYVSSITYEDTIIVEYMEPNAGYNGRRGRIFVEQEKRTVPFTGKCDFDRITSDACMNFNNDLSYHVEPFDLSEIKPFEEDYLLGFYSDIPDVDYNDAFKQASSRAAEVVKKEVLNLVDGYQKKVVYSKPHVINNGTPLLVMLPMWFMTYRYKNETYTAIVNGQTGKVVAGVPISKPKLILKCTLITLAFLTASLALCLAVSRFNFYYTIIAGILGVALMVKALPLVDKAKKQLIMSKSDTTRRFVSGRQEGQ